MKMVAEEKQLRERIREYAPILYEEKRMLSFLTAIKKAVREDCIVAYYDWEVRPKGSTVTFPEALRAGMRWRETAFRRK